MQFDRYLFAQMLRMAFAVSLTLIGIMWLFQTIRILELVINRGAPLSDFLVMSVTVIPLWLTVAMPIGTFIGVIWVFHRSLADRELLVAQASGRSAHQLARAPMALGLLVTGFLIFNSVVLLPFSFGIYKQIQFKLRNAIPTVMLQDNVFIDVVDGMTMLIGKNYDDGLAEDVFIHDERDDGAVVTMTASAGRFIEKDGQPAVILQDGQRVELTDSGEAGATLLFDSHTVFITQGDRREATRMPIEMNEDTISNLLDPGTAPSLDYANQRVAEGGETREVTVLVPVSGLQDWVSRLEAFRSLAVIDKVRIRKLDMTGGLVSLSFVGNDAAIANALAARNLRLVQREDGSNVIEPL